MLSHGSFLGGAVVTTVVGIVDDNQAILDAVSLVLNSYGWWSRCYASGEAFLADRANHWRLDCLLLDPHLQGIQGMDIARRLDPEQLPYIVFTAKPDSPIAQATYACGARAELVKPVTADQLMSKIESVLA